MLEIELYVYVDSAGDFGVGKDEDAACQQYDDDIAATLPSRLVKVVLRVPEPKTITMSGTLPEESAEGAELADDRPAALHNSECVCEQCAAR